MRPGDVILKVDDKAVGNVSQLLTAVAALKPGTPSAFEVQRADKKLRVEHQPWGTPSPPARCASLKHSTKLLRPAGTYTLSIT